jgi:hypothetical protein
MADEEPLGKRIALGIVPNVAVDRFVALSNRGVSEHLYLRGRNVKVTNKVTLEPVLPENSYRLKFLIFYTTDNNLVSLVIVHKIE